MPKSRTSAVLYLFLVFLSGALVGTFAYRLYSMKTVSAGVPATRPTPTPEELRRHYIQDLNARVKMDGDQLQKLNQILDDTKASFNEMHSRMRTEGQSIQNHQVDEINSMLRPDQRPAYAQFRADREKLRQLRNRQNQNKK
jgi:hypothetical protein